MSGGLRTISCAPPKTKTAREAEKAGLVFECRPFQFNLGQCGKSVAERLAQSLRCRGIMGRAVLHRQSFAPHGPFTSTMNLRSLQ
jgi:hypothetical protein